MAISSDHDHPPARAQPTIVGLLDNAGVSAARETADLAARRLDLEAALRATAHREGTSPPPRSPSPRPPRP